MPLGHISELERARVHLNCHPAQASAQALNAWPVNIEALTSNPSNTGGLVEPEIAVGVGHRVKNPRLSCPLHVMSHPAFLTDLTSSTKYLSEFLGPKLAIP